MVHSDAPLSTGLAGLDNVLQGLIAGDNLVWQVDSIDEYLPFAHPYRRFAVGSKQRLIYFRFADHQALAEGEGVETCRLHPEDGFEKFVTEIHRVIKSAGGGGYYLFDCLSQLAVDWYSDQMLGNFFKLTCPYLYDVGAIACFPLLRNYHSFHATAAITETTQILLDVLRHKGTLYLHPLKVQHRYSPTMYMLHAWAGEAFSPVTQSATVAEILQSAPYHGMQSPAHSLDVWSRAFLRAEEALAAVQRGEAPPEKTDECLHRLLRMAISRNERMLALAGRYLTLSDVLEIGRRMVGTGLIGGKSVGMLLARAILEQTDRRWAKELEPHDSFFIGSDVFYTFLVRNGIWWLRQHQRDPATFMDGTDEARQRIMAGAFPEHIEKQFGDMLDYFGQSPIIVRSSSLLEDSFGNAFAGKYESVFCVNQGPKQKRLESFLSAVRTIYASAMSEEALTYRAQRHMLEHDEQMALLVQRVSGAVHGKLFYPQMAGVGLSYNPYVWSRDIDPAAGVLRLVFALGTRAVDRHDDDYTRVIALNAPQRRPEADFDEAMQYTQKKVDVLDLEANQLLSKRFAEVAQEDKDMPLEMFVSRDRRLDHASGQADALTFQKVLSETNFIADMRDMLKVLQTAYEYPVDVEFTANFVDRNEYRVNLLQCRPFQYKNQDVAPRPLGQVADEDVLLKARGAVIGQSRETRIDRFVYVVPSEYGRLTISDRYHVARLIGKIAHLNEVKPPATVMLLGPGRWGTTTPSLGVPIHFSDINTVSVLCEIVAMREGLVPEVSLGTHLFSEMVEMDILYLALFPSKEGNFMSQEFFEKGPNKLSQLIPEAAQWAKVVRVIDAEDLSVHGRTIKLNANALEQKVVCFQDRSVISLS